MARVLLHSNMGSGRALEGSGRGSGFQGAPGSSGRALRSSGMARSLLFYLWSGARIRLRAVQWCEVPRACLPVQGCIASGRW